MYGVRTRRGFRGLGDTTGAVNCADFWQWPPNVLNPTCYSVTWAKLFGSPQEKAAAIAVTNPDVVYPPQPTPAPPPAPTQEQVATVPPDQLPSVLIAQGAQQTQQQNQDYFNQVAKNLDDLAAQDGANPVGLSTGTLIALGLAAGVGLLLVTSLGGRRRR